MGTKSGRTASRRDFLRLGGSALAGLALAGASGCNGGRARPRGPAEFVFSHGPDASGVFREQIERFNREHRGGIRVRYREMPTDTGQYFDLLCTEFKAGGTNIDIISGDVIWAAEFAAKGWISDLTALFTGEMRTKYLPGPMQSVNYSGRLYGVPWFTDAGMLYYRKDLLEKSGYSEAPGTWDELKETARKVREDSNIPHGFVFQGAEYEGGVVNGLEFIWNAGGDVLRDGEVTIDAPRAIEGLRAERGMVESGVAPEAVSSYKELESYTLFLDGSAVFMRNWPFVYGLASDPRQSKIKPAQIGVAPLPVSDAGAPSYSGLGGWNLMLNAGTANREAAWTFIEFMSAPERQKQRALRGGYLPTLESLYADREVLETVPVIALGKEAIRNARSRPVSPSYSKMSLVMARRFHEMLLGSATPERTAEALRGELEKLIG